MSFGFGFSLPARGLRLTDPAAAIRSLFAAGEQGVWYDPSDMSTMFQDAAGATPVTAVEQPVGLMLDKSKGLVLGPELVATPISVTGTGWSVSGNSVIASNAPVGGKVILANATDSTKKYKITFTSSNLSGATCYLRMDDLVSASQKRISSAKTYNFILNGGVYGAFLFFDLYEGQPFSVTLDNISVRELPGNHATQTTSTSRPVLSARVNLLTKTERFDDAVWFKTINENITLSANATTAPDGTSTAYLAYPASSGSICYTYQRPIATGVFTISAYVKSAGKNVIWAYIKSVASNGVVYFDLSNQTTQIVAGSAGTYASASINSVGNGWHKIIATANTSILLNGADGAGFGVTDSKGSTTIVKNGTDGVYIWGADLRVSNNGINLPPYQRVNTATDYDAAGFPHYLRFDGIDDFLVTNSINFAATDKMTVFAGVRKLSDSAVATVAELSANSGVTPNTFAVFAPGAVAPNYAFRSSGTSDSVATATTFASPITNVLAGLGEVASDTAILRIDGTQAASSTADQGTGNYGNYPLYIGRRGGTSLPFNGQLYSLIVRGAQSTDQQIIDAERYVNDKTRAYA